MVGLGSNGREMITNQQYKRLMSEYDKTGKITDSALKADVDRHTARKFIKAGKGPAALQVPHTWRTRPDPLERIWPQVAAMLQDAPKLEAKTLFEHFLALPESGLEEGHLRTFYRRVRHGRATQGPEQVPLGFVQPQCLHPAPFPPKKRTSTSPSPTIWRRVV